MPRTFSSERIFTYFSRFAAAMPPACAALALALALLLTMGTGPAQAQDAAKPGDGQGGKEPSWQVTRPVDKTVIPLDESLTYDGQVGQNQPGQDQPGQDQPGQDQPGQDKAKDKPQAASPAPKPAPAPESKPTAKPAAKPAPNPAAKPGNRIGPVRAEVQADALILTVPCAHAPGDVSFVNVFHPKRLALDIQGAWELDGKNVLRPDDPRVKAVVLGEHPDKFRLVVHYADEEAEYPVKPVVESRPDVVILRIPLP